MKSPLFTARDAAIAIVAAAVAAAIALLVRLPSDAKASDFLSLVGTFAGAAIAIIGSLIVVSRQLERGRDRHHRTAEILFQDVIDRFQAIERLVDDSRRDEDTADRIRPLLTDSPISLRVAATAIDRIRVESPALAQIAGPVDAWPSMADEIAENVKYVSKDLVFDAYDVLRYAAEDARRSQARLANKPYLPKKMRKRARIVAGIAMND